MSKFNLTDLVAEMAKHKAQAIDSALSRYVAEAVNNLTKRGENIEDWTLVAIDNPVKLTGDSARITQQWRIVRVSDVQNLPLYEERKYSA